MCTGQTSFPEISAEAGIVRSGNEAILRYVTLDAMLCCGWFTSIHAANIALRSENLHCVIIAHALSMHVKMAGAGRGSGGCIFPATQQPLI